jgi:broad specificity phosphatase PhoE
MPSARAVVGARSQRLPKQHRVRRVILGRSMNDLIHLYLARHGRTDWNHVGRFQGHSDVPLDDVGREQARAFAAALRGKVEAVISSDLVRARETATLIAEALRLPFLGVDVELRERGYGVFEGLTRDECIARHPQAWAARGNDRNFEPPGGEPNAQVLARMRRALERTVARVRGRYRHALVIGHGSSLRMLLEQLEGTPQTALANLECRVLLHDGATFSRAQIE